MTIALQTKVESASRALKLINEEVANSREGRSFRRRTRPQKKTLIESPLSPSTRGKHAELFAGRGTPSAKDSHYIDYVNAINAVTAEQVKAMIVKYFDTKKMTVSIVGLRINSNPSVSSRSFRWTALDSEISFIALFRTPQDEKNAVMLQRKDLPGRRHSRMFQEEKKPLKTSLTTETSRTVLRELPHAGLNPTRNRGREMFKFTDEQGGILP